MMLGLGLGLGLTGLNYLYQCTSSLEAQGLGYGVKAQDTCVRIFCASLRLHVSSIKLRLRLVHPTVT